METRMEKALRKKIDAFYIKHGRREAEAKIVSRGISRSMAQKLLAGTYPHQPQGTTLLALMEALDMK